jgi:1-acyl-sn-glycerol-3-phosphate acyltransferase
MIALYLISFVTFYLVRSWFIKPTLERGFRLRRAFVKITLRTLNLKIEELIGHIPDYPALFVINHRNLIDPVIISHLFDAYFIAKAEVEDYPFLGKGAALTGIIYVKREIKDSRKAARATLNETLRKGLNVVVYPEGTTGTDEFTNYFHRGSFEEAAKLEVPVVPIACEYKNKSDLWIQSSLFKQFLIQFGKKETKVKVKIHEPITSNDAVFLKEEAQRLINQSLAEMHEGWHQVWGDQNKK